MAPTVDPSAPGAPNLLAVPGVPSGAARHGDRSEPAPREREQLLEGITDALPALVAYIDRDRRYRFTSAEYERWFGYRRAELIGQHIEQIAGPEAYAVIAPHLDRAFAGESVSYEAELRYRDGKPRAVSAAYIPQREAGGAVAGVVCLVTDITERRALERQREEAAARAEQLSLENQAARARAEQLYRFAHAAVSSEAVEQVFEAALDAIEGALGTHRAAILLFDEGGTMRFRASRGLSEEYRRAVEGHSPWPQGTPAPQPVLVPDALGAPELAAYAPLFRQEGIGALAFIPLVTRGRLLGKFMVYFAGPHEFTRTELELCGAIGNHLASVTLRFSVVAELEQTLHYNELFAGVLAHDLRNPLGAMLTAAQLLLMRQAGEGDRTAKPLSRILSSGQRMSRMIDQLLDVTRARSGGGMVIAPREANLADLCSQAVEELELVYPDRAICCEITGDLAGAWDPDRVLQIISNLLANAAQHAAPGSGVDIRIDGARPDAVVLEVRNRGAIPASLLPLLFDPFRGARHRRDHSRGLGLGLFIVKELVRSHGGTVEVASSEEAGTVFTVQLPRRSSRAGA